MKANCTVGIFCLVLVAFASPAPAKNSVPAKNAKQKAWIRKTTFDYATCVVRKHHDKASDAILLASNGQDIGDLYPHIIDSNCLGSAGGGANMEMRFPGVMYFSVLADALVNVDFATHGYAKFSDRLPLAQHAALPSEKQAELLAKAKTDRKRKELQDQFDKNDALAWLARYGECVVRQDPEGARYLLLTPPDTPEETSRIKALQPAFGECIGNRTLTFNRLTIRGTVAINYYRLAMATIVPGSGSNH